MPGTVDDPDLAALAARYRRDAAAWSAAPRSADVGKRLRRASAACLRAAEAVGDLRPADLELAGIPSADAAASLDTLDALAGRARLAAEDLHRRAGKGGRRRLAAVTGALPPRAALLLEVRRRLGDGATNAQVLDLAAEVLALAGQSAAGLEDVLARLRNQLGCGPVLPCPARMPVGTVPMLHPMDATPCQPPTPQPLPPPATPA